MLTRSVLIAALVVVLLGFTSCTSQETKSARLDSRYEYLQNIDDKLTALEKRVDYMKENAGGPAALRAEAELAEARQRVRDLQVSNDQDWQRFRSKMNVTLTSVRQTLQSIPAE